LEAGYVGNWIGNLTEDHRKEKTPAIQEIPTTDGANISLRECPASRVIAVIAERGNGRNPMAKRIIDEYASNCSRLLWISKNAHVVYRTNERETDSKTYASIKEALKNEILWISNAPFIEGCRYDWIIVFNPYSMFSPTEQFARLQSMVSSRGLIIAITNDIRNIPPLVCATKSVSLSYTRRT
jgi:hypothetical protein